MNRKEINTTAKKYTVEAATRTATSTSILAGRAMRLATIMKARIGESISNSGLRPEPQRSRTQEALHSPALWAFGGSLAAGAAATVKPVRERLITTTKKVQHQVREMASEYIGGKTQESRDYGTYGDGSPGQPASGEVAFEAAAGPKTAATPPERSASQPAMTPSPARPDTMPPGS